MSNASGQSRADGGYGAGGGWNEWSVQKRMGGGRGAVGTWGRDPALAMCYGGVPSKQARAGAAASGDVARSGSAGPDGCCQTYPAGVLELLDA